MASELISEAVVAMEFKASAKTSRASATLTRPVGSDQEAALAVDTRTLNFNRSSPTGALAGWPPAPCALNRAPEVEEFYQNALQQRDFKADAAQRRAVDRLQLCYDEWCLQGQRSSTFKA